MNAPITLTIKPTMDALVQRAYSADMPLFDAMADGRVVASRLTQPIRDGARG
jgi:hypothetical protein